MKDSPRFLQYKAKVIHLTATSEEMLSLVPNDWKFSISDFRMEDAMRVMMIRKFREISSSHPQYALVQSIMASIFPYLGRPDQHRRNHDMYFSNHTRLVKDVPLAIQADGDEIITRKTLLHMKHCALKSPSFPIYTPCYSYKHNIHTLQRESFLHLLMDADYDISGEVPRKVDDTKQLLHYLNSAGPMVDTLYSFLSVNSTQRVQRMKLDVHMGLGAAMHISSVGEPGELWCKAGSTHHGLENRDMFKVMTQRFIDKGKQGVLDANDIFKVTHINALLRRNHSADGKEKICFSGMEHSSTARDEFKYVRTFSEDLQLKIKNDLPYALRKYPDRYPFIAPPFCDRF